MSTLCMVTCQIKEHFHQFVPEFPKEFLNLSRLERNVFVPCLQFQIGGTGQSHFLALKEENVGILCYIGWISAPGQSCRRGRSGIGVNLWASPRSLSGA